MYFWALTPLLLGVPGRGLPVRYDLTVEEPACCVAKFADALTAEGSPDRIAEVNQFLATLLLVQGIDGVDPADKDALLPKLRTWKSTPKFRGRLASEASDRVISLLGLTRPPALSGPVATTLSGCRSGWPAAFSTSVTGHGCVRRSAALVVRRHGSHPLPLWSGEYSMFEL